MFDTQVPPSLLAIQKWFGHIVCQPLQSDNRLLSHLGQDANEHINKTNTLSPRDRLEIYHQQYWWRLLEAMHENFPSVTRLFGYKEFNEKIAIPYLTKHPSQSFSLNHLGNLLPSFLEKNYPCEKDKELVCAMAHLDLMLNISFLAPHVTSQNSLDPQELIESPLKFQKHVHLFEAPADFLSFREEFIKNSPEDYDTKPFPELSLQPIYAIIYRNASHFVSWKFVSQEAFTFIKLMKEGQTIAALCEKMEKESWKEQEELSLWLYEWTKLELFFCP